MQRILILAFSFFPIASFGQAFIRGTADEGISIRYCEPIGPFGNEFLEDGVTKNEKGEFNLSLKISKPFLVKLKSRMRPFAIFCEPGDTISMRVKPWSATQPWLVMTGKNASGNVYYNVVYNANPVGNFHRLGDIFEKGSDIFEKSKDLDQSVLFNDIMKEVNRQTVWIDSLYELGQVTANFKDLMKIQIRAKLGWVVGDLCDRHFGRKLTAKSQFIMEAFFREVDPLDEKLKACPAASGYYYTYFDYLSRRGTNKIDSARVIVPESPHYAFAPDDIQEFMWGLLILMGNTMNPAQYDYCSLIKKYNQRFHGGWYEAPFREAGVCKVTAEQAVNVLEVADGDLASLSKDYFEGKRILVDLWATWCGPCKLEFGYYTDQFKANLKARHVDVVYISIDKPAQKQQWEKELKVRQLGGYHILAGPKLVASIQKTIYGKSPMIIPRYLVIEDGKILSADFTRPSDARFESELAKLFPMK